MSKTTNALIALGVVAGLSAAAMPLTSYAADTTVTDPAKVEDTEGTGSVEQAVGVNLTVEKILSIDADADNVNLNKTNNYTGTALKLNVITNNTKGYKLTAAGNGKLTADNDNADVINAFSKNIAGGTLEALALESGESVWGYTVSGDDAVAAFTGGLYAGVVADGETIATSDGATAEDGNETQVTFAAKLKGDQPAGTYTGTVTFTASDLN